MKSNQKHYILLAIGIIGILIILGWALGWFKFLQQSSCGLDPSTNQAINSLVAKLPSEADMKRMMANITEGKNVVQLLQQQIAVMQEFIDKASADYSSEVKEFKQRLTDVLEDIQNGEAALSDAIDAMVTKEDAEKLMASLKDKYSGVTSYNKLKIKNLPTEDSDKIRVRPGDVFVYPPTTFEDRGSEKSKTINYTFVFDITDFKIGDWFAIDTVQAPKVTPKIKICTLNFGNILCNVVVDDSDQYGKTITESKQRPIKFVVVGREGAISGAPGSEVWYVNSYKYVKLS